MSDPHTVYQRARLTRDGRFDGKFFVAVKSTGIFCRPICPAPTPKEQNVEYFELAQSAMQAGYRPCLRCRPDSAPGSCAWRGVDTTVERAVGLIKSYPQLTLLQICEKLGVSDRYLRALFSKKLGISPKQFKRFDQLLFAKQLLHQSHLTIEQVAQASGFSSARRLQDNMQSGMQLTPSQIRKQLPNAEGKRDNHLHLHMTFRSPYHWPQVRDFLARRAIAGIETVTNSSYARTFTLDGSHGWFEAEFNPLKGRFDIELQVEDLSKIHSVVAHIRRLLDIDADPVVIAQGLKDCGLREELIVTGLRIPGIWDSFEAGCRAILGQQISVAAAINLVTLLAEKCGTSHPMGRLFPSAEAVANSDLLFLKMPAARRECLKRFAVFYSENQHVFDLSQWQNLKGIGPWTVAYAQMRGQSQPDIWLKSDLIIKQQLAKYQLNADAAAPWRSYLTFQLWSLA